MIVFIINAEDIGKLIFFRQNKGLFTYTITNQLKQNIISE